MPLSIRQVGVDDLDRPNQRDRLPDWHDTGRKPDRVERLPVRLLAFSVIAVCAVLITGCAVFWPFLQTLASAFSDAIERNQLVISVVVLSFIVLIALGIVSIVFGIARYIGNRAEQAAIIRMQNDQPVHFRHLKRPQILDMARGALDRYYDTQTVWAANSAHRNMNTYGPSISYRYDNNQEGTPIAETPLLPDTIPFIEGKTKIEQLRERGHICRSGNSLMIGYALDTTPQYIEMQNASFVAVAGQPRVGKTSTVRFLLAQAALMDWHIAICDPHGKQDQGLLTRCAPISGSFIRQAIEPSEIVDAIELIDKIGRARINGDRVDKPVLLVIDEFTSLVLRQAIPDDVLARLTAMVVEYSKVSVHGLIIGHDWTGKLLGASFGTPLRRAITHKIVHRSDVQNAEFLLPNASLAKQVTTLDKGNALYWGDYAPMPVAVPWIGDDDIRFAGRGKPTKPYTPRPPRVALPSNASVAAISAPAPMTIKDQIVNLLRQVQQERTSEEIAITLGADVKVIRTELKALVDEGRIQRSGAPRNYGYRA